MFFVDGGNNSVQVGSATPNLKFWHGTTLGPKFMVEQVGAPEAGNYVTIAAVRHDNSSEPPQLGFAKSRATAAGGVTVAVAGDSLGLITFQGADGTNYIEGARIASTVESGVGGNDMPADLRFFTNRGTTATAESMRITSSGNVGIFGTNPITPSAVADSSGVANLQLSGTFITHFDTDAKGTTAFANNKFWDGSNNKALFAGEASEIQMNSGVIKFRNAASVSAGANNTMVERMRLTAAGDVSLITGNLIVGTSGKGIDFSAGAAGASTSNLLDEYEEGTHDPTVTCSGSGDLNVNGAINTLFYTKVGRMVNVVGRISFSSVSSPVGAIIMTLPFVILNAADATAAANVSINGIASGDVAAFWAECDQNQSRLVIYKTGGTSVAATSANLMGSGSDIRVMVTYATTS